MQNGGGIAGKTDSYPKQWTNLTQEGYSESDGAPYFRIIS